MRNPLLNIPVDLLQYVYDHEMRKPFRLYLYLKAVSSGKLHNGSLEFTNAMKVLNISDQRTFKKYMNTLLQHNLIGFNPISGYWFVRGFMKWRQISNLKHRQSVKFNYEKDIDHFDSFSFAVVVGARVKRIEFWKIREQRKQRFAGHNRGAANHNLIPSPEFPKD